MSAERVLSVSIAPGTRGSIVNISSSGSVGRPHADEPGVWHGRNPAFRNQPYDASKAALTNMSFYLADELKPRNVAVNVVFPGGHADHGLRRDGRRARAPGHPRWAAGQA